MFRKLLKSVLHTVGGHGAPANSPARRVDTPDPSGIIRLMFGAHLNEVGDQNNSHCQIDQNTGVILLTRGGLLIKIVLMLSPSQPCHQSVSAPLPVSSPSQRLAQSLARELLGTQSVHFPVVLLRRRSDLSPKIF